jgi:hypothetical protein
MISIFRKIRKKFFSNKVSSYFLYAIGEITLVMIGILLALYVNNLNEKRQKNQQLTSIFKTIKKDMVTDTLVATEIIKFYDSINKYSTKIISYEYDSKSIDNCTLCKSLTTVYQPFTIQDKGYQMLNKYEEFGFKKEDTLPSIITQFYKISSNMIAQNNEFVKTETLKNLEFYTTQPWFIDWMQGRSTKEIKTYFGESLDYKNRVAANLILANSNHSNTIKRYKESAKEIISLIDKRMDND